MAWSCQFAGEPAPTGLALTARPAQDLWERACRGVEPPRSRRRGGWHGLRPCSRACPLPQGLCKQQHLPLAC
ncbi:hypothetical protein CXG50_17830 [Pseudomonas plecoglossicida]|nr:hypothetical protein CX682_15545 [Pseudomonas sp. FFUP_PS_41]PLU94271.1 hypothetical protein CXG52_22940 [Pseudomonas plecoglossicida]PLV07406.1 hypothetical protein CXG50_17830 [Pseudomonas plecoglossicida]QKK98075.1 hypothetical protein GEV38_19860 [Pseudomonas sp. 13159349]